MAEGLKQIWEVRPQAAPNPGFMVQLKALERNVFGKCSETEVMQGQWKERLSNMKIKSDAKKAANPDMSVEE